MESNTPVIAKKVLSIIRVAFFMLRKGISKGKLMMHLNNMMLKRPGKAIANLMFHHHHNHGVSGNNLQFSTAREYEFSCSNTPQTGVLEMLNNETVVEASPAALPGFGRSPMVRKLIRVTDSPFPLGESEDDKDNQVDKAAEEFIKRFYKELRKQT
ncbi:hypothetical protein glysoja_018018 [Glycine soja]|nr:hypothetical protein glysoja_018018 [Glycine soja]